ncbi:hypothetical protein EDC94DRAFT_645845 [Helicostylum pulchrum]|nr:hypothetical protein EDC94DRAFT_645845 [Helicostylum pulchrum]
MCMCMCLCLCVCACVFFMSFFFNEFLSFWVATLLFYSDFKNVVSSAIFFFVVFYPCGLLSLLSFILVVFYPCKFFFLVVEALWCICYDISVGAWLTFGTLALVYFVLLSCSGVSYMIDIYTRFFAQAKESGAWSTLTVELILVFKDDLEKVLHIFNLMKMKNKTSVKLWRLLGLKYT